MSTVRVYKSTDPGAPPHPSATRGSMAALLRACLVEGWTSGDFVAEPAGWEEPFPEAANYACFRAMSGIRKFYQIDDNAESEDISISRCFDSMADAQTGMGLRAEHNFGKWYSSQISKKWVVIADQKTCYVALQGHSGTSYGIMRLHGFGEFFSYVADDVYRFFLAGHKFSTRLDSGWNSVGIGCCSQLGTSSSIDTFSIGSNMHQELDAKASIAAVSGSNNHFHVDGGNFPVSIAGQDTVSPLMPVRFYSHAPTEELIFRGHLRGVYLPGRRYDLFSGDEYMWHEVNYGGKPFLVLSHGSYYNWPSPFAFDLTSWNEGA